MSYLDYIDIYCERLEPGLLAEPVNAITNVAFFIAALAALALKTTSLRAQAKQSTDCRVATAPRNDIGAWLLITLIFAMGIGSTLFHTFARVWAMLSDVLPILLYQLSFIIFYARNCMHKSPRFIGALLILFLLLMSGFMQAPRAWLNGSLEYAPALIFVSGFAFWHYMHARKERYTLALAALCFVVSLALRSMDMVVCESFPLGTHFLWHCLNAVVLYLTARAYIKASDTV